MKPRTFSSEAIVLSRRNYGEADRILVLFTKAYGKLSLLAKGVRKPKSRKRGHLEEFSKIKFSAVYSKGLPLMTEVETIESYPGLRNDLKKVAVAFFIMDVVDKLTKEEEKNNNFYELILGTLDDLNTSKNLKELRKEFIRQSLTQLGFWPIGKKMVYPDKILEEVLERKISSARVGKKLLT